MALSKTRRDVKRVNMRVVRRAAASHSRVQLFACRRGGGGEGGWSTEEMVGHEGIVFAVYAFALWLVLVTVATDHKLTVCRQGTVVRPRFFVCLQLFRVPRQTPSAVAPRHDGDMYVHIEVFCRRRCNHPTRHVLVISMELHGTPRYSIVPPMDVHGIPFRGIRSNFPWDMEYRGIPWRQYVECKLTDIFFSVSLPPSRSLKTHAKVVCDFSLFISWQVDKPQVIYLRGR